MKTGKKSFFAGKGFYGILLLCAIAVAVSGYVVFSDDREELPEPVNVEIWEADLPVDAAETEEIRERIEREYLSIEYLKAARVADAEERAKAVDLFAEKVIRFRLTEIMERRNLYDSFEYMKRGEIDGEKREGKYLLYYVVK